MELGKYKMGLQKALDIVDEYNKGKHQNYSSYAVARQICFEAGYVWTVGYGGKA